jgi:hypothetical protein
MTGTHSLPVMTPYKFHYIESYLVFSECPIRISLEKTKLWSWSSSFLSRVA